MRFTIWILFHLVRYRTETLLLWNCVFCFVFAVAFAHVQCIVYHTLHRSHEWFLNSPAFKDSYSYERSFRWLQICTLDIKGAQITNSYSLCIVHYFFHSSFIRSFDHMLDCYVHLRKNSNKWSIYRLKNKSIVDLFQHF